MEALDAIISSAGRSETSLVRLQGMVVKSKSGEITDVQRALACLALQFGPLRERDTALAVLVWAAICRFESNNAAHALLARALSDMQDIADAGLRRRLAHAAWHCLLRKRLGEVAALNAKVGKTLKLQLCERNFGVDDVALTEILALLTAFLRGWLQDVKAADSTGRKSSETGRAEGEEAGGHSGHAAESSAADSTTLPATLGGAEPSCAGAESLLTGGVWPSAPENIAANLTRPLTGDFRGLGFALNASFQRQPSAGLLQSHLLLCEALRLIMVHKLRGVKALQLFGEPLRARLFSPLHVPPDGLAAEEIKGNATPAVRQEREAFAARLLSAAMHGDQASLQQEAADFAQALGCSADFIASRKIVALVEVSWKVGGEDGGDFASFGELTKENIFSEVSPHVLLCAGFLGALSLPFSARAGS